MKKQANIVRNYSPLRYPGGKTCLSTFLGNLTSLNDLTGGTYCELYAGGSGAALNLLFSKHFNHIHINDADYSIYSFWHSVLNRTEELVKLIWDTDITIEEWYKQKKIFSQGRAASSLDLGFATFFLNRTNRSGIIFKAGPIGGLDQTGNFKIDVRFNKSDLIERINKIASVKNSITLTNADAIEVLSNIEKYHSDPKLFLYLDPPYYNKGKTLYLNNYDALDHRSLSIAVAKQEKTKWLVSYDNVAPIRELYQNFRKSAFDLNYSLQSKKNGSELLVFSNNLILTDTITVNSRESDLVLMQ